MQSIRRVIKLLPPIKLKKKLKKKDEEASVYTMYVATYFGAMYIINA